MIGKGKWKTTIIVAVLIVAALAVAMYVAQTINKPYVAVLLTSGDLYIGQASYFPSFVLTDVHSLQAVPDPENPDQVLPQLVPLDLSVWAPDKININRDEIVFTTSVGKDSQVMQQLLSRINQ